jgi:alanyl-tRNA synthetase
MQKTPEYSFAQAHTAEHAFVGALQNMTGQTLNVMKVNHREDNNTVFIRRVPEIDLELVIRAQVNLNQLINRGRKVTSYTFSSLNEAKKRFPTLRANEERITGPDPIRVIEIENHDLAACNKDHLTNLAECGFFLVTTISNNKDIVEIDFSVGLQAKEAAIHVTQKLLNVCNIVGANINSIENTVRKLKHENEDSMRKLRAHSRESLNNIKPYTLGSNKITIFQSTFTDLVDSEIRTFADNKIINDNTVVIIANAHSDSDSSSSHATLTIARNESLKNIDCDKIVKEIVSRDGRGGGKPHFATGMIRKDATTDIIHTIVTLITKL